MEKHKIFSRKQFLNEIIIRGFRALATFRESSGEGEADLSSDCHSLIELSPSLLKIEAERLGIDPAHVDEEEVRRKVYAALSEQCR